MGSCPLKSDWRKATLKSGVGRKKEEGNLRREEGEEGGGGGGEGEGEERDLCHSLPTHTVVRPALSASTAPPSDSWFTAIQVSVTPW